MHVYTVNKKSSGCEDPFCTVTQGAKRLVKRCHITFQAHFQREIFFSYMLYIKQWKTQTLLVPNFAIQLFLFNENLFQYVK